jgi:Lon protease-like protein
MVLGSATLFPHGYMPLFIFEHRYRAMLSHALQGARMFCVGHSRPQEALDEDEGDLICPVTTIGLVRACVTHDDGTSHLMLSGLTRVEILSWEQEEPYRIARIAPIVSTVADPDRCRSLACDVVDLCGRLCGHGKPMSNQLRDHLRCVDDPAAVADVVSQTFLSDPDQRQRLLETPCVDERLAMLAQHLGALLAKGPG